MRVLDSGVSSSGIAFLAMELLRGRSLARELEWIRMAPRARQSKGKARVQAYEELLTQDERVRLLAGAAPSRPT